MNIAGGSAASTNGSGGSVVITPGAKAGTGIDGIIRNVSVGYRVHRYEVIRSDGAVPLYRAVDWEPYEISVVSVPADASVGIGRAAHDGDMEVRVIRAESQQTGVPVATEEMAIMAETQAPAAPTAWPWAAA